MVKKWIRKSARIVAHEVFLNHLSDEAYIRLMYYIKFRRTINLNNPKTYNEKQQWLKLYDRKPEYSTMVDKYEAKKYITERIGEGYTISTLGVWERVEDIDFDMLPDQFVLKCTHDSGGLVICRDKGKLDIIAAKKQIEQSMRTNYFIYGREWPYKNVKPRIIAEPLIHNNDNSMLEEYNFFCFNGEPKFFMHCYGDEDEGETRYNDYFTIDGERLHLQWGNDSSPSGIFKSFNAYDDMLQKARVLTEGVPFLRVDFYLADGKAVMGELTFFNWGGMMPIHPPEYDVIFGEMLQLPQNNNAIHYS